MPELPAFKRRVGGRIAFVVEATIYGRKVITYNLHLESRGGDDLRLRQLNEVLADCRKYVGRPPLVVAGDFNLNAGR
jgi:endonuclease/exonuclease/phosphatase family metal-dependent hydrolase